MIKLLLVDDDEVLRTTLTEALEQSGFEVTTALNVPQALELIGKEKFDVLLSDLHLPEAGNGLTAISAMRHANPAAVTLLLNAFPLMATATQAILLQDDEILVKPMSLSTLVDVIQHRVAIGPARHRLIESVAQILERTAETTIQAWFRLVQKEEKLQSVPLSYELRSGYLHQVFRELIIRLKSSKEIGGQGSESVAAAEHGLDRRRRGYSAAMLVEESRLLQVSIFQTLQNNLANIDFSLLLIGVMTIADEIDSQLSQAMVAYKEESIIDLLPA
jgi:ActR/RegA family two-component response regulator